jgi:hypothetical protein
LRHDVDHNLKEAITMAKIEHELGIVSSYYFLPPGDYGTDKNYYGTIVNNKVIHSEELIAGVLLIQSLGHEIGLHNDFLQLSVKLQRPISTLILEEINFFSKIGIKIHGSASHGSRFARQHEYANFQIFSDRLNFKKEKDRKVVRINDQIFVLPCLEMKSLELEYEAYDLANDLRISDVGGKLTLSNKGRPAQVFNFIESSMDNFKSNPHGRCVCLIHADWWTTCETKTDLVTENKSFTTSRSILPMDSQFKSNISLLPSFMRNDGKLFRVAVRGDCCSRRAIKMNSVLFPKGFEIIVNEKAPNKVFVDSISGINPDRKIIANIIDETLMPKTLASYFNFQFDRSILSAKDLDLLVMDNYSDMNFQLWTHKTQGWSIWIHPKFTNMEQLKQDFINSGYVSMDYAIQHICAIIDAVRINNPSIPVLFLNQPIEFYPKLQNRKEFYQIGKAIEQLRSNIYAATPLTKDYLTPDDLGSCGAGQTLHFSRETYLQMIEDAWVKGLSNHFSPGMGQTATKEFSLAKNNTLTSPISLNTSSVEVFNFKCPVSIKEINDIEIPIIKISYGIHRPLCTIKCSSLTEGYLKSFDQYFIHPELESGVQGKRFTPMIIPLNNYSDFESWEKPILKFGKGSKKRKKRLAIENGYYVKKFPWALHIPDVHEINHSKESRSGGPMRGAFLRSLEEMGGYPTKHHEVEDPRCFNHWGLTFGAFISVEGYKQGDIITNEKLVAYISLRRCGDFALYSQILCHGEHLAGFPLVLLHHEVVRWVYENKNTITEGLDYLMYGGAQNGGESLYFWKRQAGFKPCRITAFKSDRIKEEEVEII